MTAEQTTENFSEAPAHSGEQINFEETIEAILFAAGHPVTYEQLAKTFEIPVSELKQIVISYAEKYNSSTLPRGISLILFDTCCQLCTKPAYIADIRNALGIRRTGGTLSGSTIEALTIVAYQQPVTRAYVDAVRNADSSYAMTNLIDRGLIEPKGRKDVPGRPILYGTTNAFLRCFGLKSLNDLPGTTGEAQNIFRSINNRLRLDDGEHGEQMNIDEIMSGPNPEVDASAEEPQIAPDDGTTTSTVTSLSDEKQSDSNGEEDEWDYAASEEAEKASSLL